MHRKAAAIRMSQSAIRVERQTVIRHFPAEQQVRGLETCECLRVLLDLSFGGQIGYGELVEILPTSLFVV